MAELWQLPATELATLIRSGHVSAREAVQAALDRLDDVNDAVNAVVDYRPAEALSAADAIDAQLSDGHAGPLAGVPVTVKTNVDQAGFATTEGVTLQRDLIAETNNPVVDNLLKAGAVIIGRTNMAAFASRWFTSNRLYGDTRNPRNSQLTPGGSSGGAAAAVATGIGAIAHGTDIAGSIRYPAYACGVHGLRPTLGRVPTFNASLPERTIGGQISAVSGPLARSVADLRLAFTAMSRRDLRDPWWVPAPLEGPSVAKRAAICVAPDGLETQPEVANAVRDPVPASSVQAGMSRRLPPRRLLPRPPTPRRNSYSSTAMPTNSGRPNVRVTPGHSTFLRSCERSPRVWIWPSCLGC